MRRGTDGGHQSRKSFKGGRGKIQGVSWKGVDFQVWLRMEGRVWLGIQVWWVRNGEAEKRHKDGQIGKGSERSTLLLSQGKRTGEEEAARDGGREGCSGGWV